MLKGNPEKGAYVNHKSVRANLKTVKQTIQKEVDLGRMAGPFVSPPLKNFVTSPLGLVPKKEPGQFRLIHDLSFPRGQSVNSNIDTHFATVQYETLDHCVDIIQKLGPNTLMAKADIQEAFRNVPIHPKDYKFLGFVFENKYYYDKCLPFGCSSSCQNFELLSTALQWICVNKFGVQHASHILDDFIFFAPEGSDQCKKDLITFMALCQQVGLPVKKSKTVWPGTKVQLHGIEVDTATMHLRLPQDKLVELRCKVAAMLRRKKVTLHDMQSLLGSLNFACRAVVPGRPFMRRLIELTVGISRPNHWIRLTNEARKDLAAWDIFLTSFNGRLMCLPSQWVSSEVIRLETDASGFAFAAVLGSRWLQGSFPTSWAKVNIAVKELLPIVLAVKKWGADFANSRVLFLTDNESIMYVINDQSSKNKQIMQLVRQLVVAAMSFNIHFRAQHIAGKLNVIPDLIS
jgi:hypothetical protein